LLSSCMEISKKSLKHDLNVHHSNYCTYLCRTRTKTSAWAKYISERPE
jgi:hypothetical protein